MSGFHRKKSVEWADRLKPVTTGVRTGGMPKASSPLETYPPTADPCYPSAPSIDSGVTRPGVVSSRSVEEEQRPSRGVQPARQDRAT